MHSMRMCMRAHACQFVESQRGAYTGLYKGYRVAPVSLIVLTSCRSEVEHTSQRNEYCCAVGIDSEWQTVFIIVY